MQPLAYVDDPCLKTAIMSIPNRSKMGWTRRLPEMTLRDDINVVFTRAMPTSLLRRSCTESSIGGRSGGVLPVGFWNLHRKYAQTDQQGERSVLLCGWTAWRHFRVHASRRRSQKKKMQGGAYQRAVLLKSLPERAHPRPCNQKMHPKKFFLNAEFFMLLGCPKPKRKLTPTFLVGDEKSQR